MSCPAYLPHIHNRLCSALQSLGALHSPQGEIFLVGGGVRDLLLGRPVKDMDLACRNAGILAADLAQALDTRLVPLGQDHTPPSFRLILHASDHTVTDEPPMTLDITEIHGRDILEDLSRRDFSVNAMSMPLGPVPGKLASMMVRESIAGNTPLDLLDPHGGRMDIRKGLVRRTGPETIAEDPLRILRGFRLRAQLGWVIDPATLEDMADQALALDRISGERLSAELQLILECPGGGCLLPELERIGVLDVLFPEIREMRGCDQNHFHHLDVLGHSLAAVEQCEAVLAEFTHPASPLREPILGNLIDGRLSWLKLAVLLHDVGKPQARGRNASTGRVTFYGHDALGAEMAGKIAERLRLSGAERSYLVGLIRHHLHLGVLLRPEATKKARLRWMRRLGRDMIPTLLLCLADIRATCGPAALPEDRQVQEAQGFQLIQEYMEQARTTLVAPPLLTGHDLISQGITPGPDMGRILKAVQEAQDAGEVGTKQDALALAATIRSEWDQRTQCAHRPITISI